MQFKDLLNESGLSRIQKHMNNHDTALLTAFRYAKDCGQGEKYSKQENMKRNKSLLSKLQSKRYGVTSVKGSYIENFGSKDEREVGENVFFVVDLEDKGNLLKDVKKLGEQFEQDSVLFIPKGGSKSELHGTNKCPDGYPGYGKVIVNNKRMLGASGEFFTRIKGRPFVFENDMYEHILPQGYMGRMACKAMAKSHWSIIDLD